MRLRSLLFVPGDRPDRMEKALTSGADALILDLEDSVLPQNKVTARQAVARFLARPRGLSLFVRVNALGTETDADLAVVLPHGPDGIVLPKAEGGASLADLDRRLMVRGNSRARILPIATETPKAVFALGSYGGVTSRLCGLSWGAEDLPATIGATTAREEDGRFTPPYETVRALALFGAHAAQVPAIETVYPAFRDEAGLAAYAARGKRDGFSGMLAIHPAQIAAINAAFAPSPAEIAWAERVVAAFAQNAGAGTLQLDGRMLDAPHLQSAKRILSDR
jgi:citrate lyase subunit beta / citryl-CoA lyase